MKVALEIEIVSLKKGIFIDPETKKEIPYFQGFLKNGTQIKLSEKVFDSLVSKKIPSDLTLAKGSKITTSEDGSVISI